MYKDNYSHGITTHGGIFPGLYHIKMVITTATLRATTYSSSIALPYQAVPNFKSLKYFNIVSPVAAYLSIACIFSINKHC